MGHTRPDYHRRRQRATQRRHGSTARSAYRHTNRGTRERERRDFHTRIARPHYPPALLTRIVHGAAHPRRGPPFRHHLSPQAALGPHLQIRLRRNTRHWPQAQTGPHQALRLRSSNQRRQPRRPRLPQRHDPRRRRKSQRIHRAHRIREYYLSDCLTRSVGRSPLAVGIREYYLSDCLTRSVGRSPLAVGIREYFPPILAFYIIVGFPKPSPYPLRIGIMTRIGYGLGLPLPWSVELTTARERAIYYSANKYTPKTA